MSLVQNTAEANNGKDSEFFELIDKYAKGKNKAEKENKLSKILAEIVPEADIINSELIRQACEYARKAHEHIKRATGGSYLRHVFDTARIAICSAKGLTNEKREKLVAAAILHDSIEDSGKKDYSDKFIEFLYDNDLERIINALTRRHNDKYESYISSLMSGEAFSYSKDSSNSIDNLAVAIAIKLADQISNLKSLVGKRDIRYSEKNRSWLEKAVKYLMHHLALPEITNKQKILRVQKAITVLDAYGKLERAINYLLEFCTKYSVNSLDEAEKSLERQLDKDGFHSREAIYNLSRLFAQHHISEKNKEDIIKLVKNTCTRVQQYAEISKEPQEQAEMSEELQEHIFAYGLLKRYRLGKESEKGILEELIELKEQLSKYGAFDLKGRLIEETEKAINAALQHYGNLHFISKRKKRRAKSAVEDYGSTGFLLRRTTKEQDAKAGIPKRSIELVGEAMSSYLTSTIWKEKIKRGIARYIPGTLRNYAHWLVLEKIINYLKKGEEILGLDKKEIIGYQL